MQIVSVLFPQVFAVDMNGILFMVLTAMKSDIWKNKNKKRKNSC